MNYEEATIIDSNGTKYAVGWDKGWFDIEEVEIYENDDGERVIERVRPAEIPITSFTPKGAEKLINAIKNK